MPLRERERVRKNFFFLPYLWPKTQVSEIKGKSLVGKKSKVPFSIRNGDEKLKQVVFLMFMCTLHRLTRIDIYKTMNLLRYGVLAVFLYIKCRKKCKYPPIT